MKKLSHKNIPLFNTVYNHAKRDVTSFHTPGHKNGYSIDPKLKRFVGSKLFHMDVTVFDEVDSLHDPHGPIKDAQELYAKLYGSKHTFFLVNGTTVGNQAMFMAACKPGDSVIISRNAHKSAMSGIVLSGVWPIWIQPTLDTDYDLFFDSSLKQIEEALNKYPEARAVFITNPTYNGVCTDIEKIARLVHSHDKILLVDEAHGSHLNFNDNLPISAINAGADLVVQSAHKTLSVMSQGSVLHYNTDKIDFNKIKKIVSMLQTTSPNYLTLSTLDLARFQMYSSGKSLTDNMINISEYARNKINKMNKLFAIKRSDINKKGYDLDPTKITVNVSNLGIEGYYCDNLLSKKYNIQVDCSDSFNLIAILGVGSRKKDLTKLVNALNHIEKTHIKETKKQKLTLPSLTTEMVMSPRDIFLTDNTTYVKIKEAAGHISADTLTPYPPGIPIIIPGERITNEVCEYLTELRAKSVRISGEDSKKLNYLKIVKS